MKKQIVVRRCKAHRIGIWAFSAVFTFALLAYVIFMANLAGLPPVTAVMYCIIPVALLMPLSLYYASWQITFDANGIHERLFWFNAGSHSWAQVKEVRSTFSHTEQEVISIQFKDGKTLRFRMICENAEKARKLILSHHSIKG